MNADVSTPETDVREPAEAGAAKRLPLVILYLFAILLGALIAGGASYGLRMLNL